MNKNIFITLLVLISCTRLPTNLNKDQYWEQVVKKYSPNSGENFVDFLKTNEVEIYNQIEIDSKDEILPTLWGQSFNFDSGAKAEILNLKIIGDLQEKFKVKNDNKIVHAGIMHSYGYLFSTLNTPYGFKRKRWIDPTFDVGFNLEKKSISPHPSEGSLLSNISFFAGTVAFKENGSKVKLGKLINVSSEVKKFNYSSLKIVTLIEEITNQSDFPFIFRTDLIKLQNKSDNEENDYILVYSFQNKQTKEEKLITAFPIKKDAYLKTIDPVLLGEDRPIIVRYNGYVGIPNEARLSGKRLILGRE